MIFIKQIKQAGKSFPLIVKKSKFITFASPINNELEAQKFISKIKNDHKKATHNCFAYRLSIDNTLLINSDDDGEPSGTAGDSILYVLEKQEITNTIVIVSRFYGGIKLGKGGLVRAYAKSTSNLIKSIGLINI